MLPEVFITQMKNLLSPDEFRAFLDTYNDLPMRGIRFNKLKMRNWLITNDDAPKSNDLGSAINAAFGQADDFLPIPWCKEGYSFTSDLRPAKSLLYHTGLFYIQEPSAMCPVEVLQPKPGEKVLDICAAPGGKTVQIAGHMNNQGLLVSNDKSPSRCRGLIKNIELAGITNAIVTTEEPRKLAKLFPDFFDKILVDAPCSGEGMFRKDKDLINAYNENKPQKCAAFQKEILYYASDMLKLGGKMVYSTCTFNPQENEMVIAEFLENHRGFELKKINTDALGAEPGKPEWINAKHKNLNLDYTARIWPHKANAEGHFIALIKKRNYSSSTKGSINESLLETNEEQKRGEQALERLARSALAKGLVPLSKPSVCASPPEFEDFCKNHLNISIMQGFFTTIGTNLYLQPEKLYLSSLRVARSGFFLGEIKKSRFIPSQALAMALNQSTVKYSVDLSEEEAERYLKGESISYEQTQNIHKPWIHINYKGLALGWARLVDNRLKNCLPVSWVTNY